LNICEIDIINFRNYSHANFRPTNFNILYGNNAQGKSNFIEAIYYLGNGISYRTNQSKDLINWNSDYFRLEACCTNYKGTITIKSILSTANVKNIYIDGIKINRLSELFKNISVCIFNPDDLALVKGNPSKRRNFLDREIIAIQPLYYDLIKKYYNVNHQRNSLLKFVRRDKNLIGQLEDWTDIYAKLAYKIVVKRVDFLKKIKPYLKYYLKKITQNK